jgi:hypothetical protein
MRRPRSFQLLAAALVTLSLIAACSSNDDAVVAAGLEAGCSINSDCTSGLVCAFRTCHQECIPNDAGGSRDCPNNEQCLASDRPFYVCQNPNETTCQYNSDCPSPLVCGRDLQCRDQCLSASDCQVNQECVTGTCANIAQLVDGGLVAPVGVDASQPNPPCTYNTDCPEPDVCRFTGFCGLECQGDRDCAVGDVCTGNRCIMPGVDASALFPDASTSGGDSGPKDAAGGVVDATITHVPDGAPPGYASSCALNSDCPSPLVCLSSICVYQCVTNADCDTLSGQCCSPLHTCATASACATTFADAAVDAGPTNSGDGGKPCSDEGQCQDGVFCNGVEQCLAGHCYPASKAACDDGNSCTSDACTEATQSCTNTSLGNSDVDGDGYISIACGGNDCDDTNATIYPGHAEICDGLDNNCDGRADEGLWTAGVGTTFSNIGVVPYDIFSSQQAVARFSSGAQAGDFVVFATGGSSVCAYVVNASFQAVGTEACTPVLGGNYGINIWPTLALHGSSFLGSTGGAATNSAFDSTGLFYSDATLANVGSKSLAGTAIASASLAWNDSANGYVGVWPDTRDGFGYAVVYVGTVTQAGNVSRAQSLSGISTDIAVPQSAGLYAARRVRSATSGTTAIVAFSHLTNINDPANGTHNVRFGIYDAQLNSIQTPGLVDLTETEDKAVVGLFYTNNTYVLASADDAFQHFRLRTIDATTGVLVATTTFSTTSTETNSDFVALGTGIGLDIREGGATSFGYIPLALDKSIAFTSFGDPSGGTAVSALAPIDAKHAVLTSSVSANTTTFQMLTCAP